MSLFVCAKCGCIENTALGHYWCRNNIEWFEWPEDLAEFKGRALCSECMPQYYKNGTRHSNGEWHGRFEKEHWSKKYKVIPDGTF